MVAACVCDFEPSCCEDIWHPICADLVELVGCGRCGDPPPPPPPPPPPAEPGSCANPFELGNQVPITVGGSTFGASNDVEPRCAANGSPEHAYRFVAPQSGYYWINTYGSVYDTALYVIDGANCLGPDIGCNDDTGGLQSELLVQIQAGQMVTIVVDGYGGDMGSYTLHIEHANGGGGDCCEASGFPGCPDQDVQQCVCGADPFCCQVEWDARCAAEVEGLGCGVCN